MKVVTVPVRLPVALAIALPEMVRELPGAARDVRAVLGGLARLTSRNGELTVLLREAAELAARSGHDGRGEVRSRASASSGSRRTSRQAPSARVAGSAGRQR